MSSRGQKFWLQGPDFLLRPDDEHPVQPDFHAKPKGVENEYKPHHARDNECVVAVALKHKDSHFLRDHPVSKLLAVTSDTFELIRKIIWLQRFIYRSKADSPTFNDDEISAALNVVAKYIQLAAFPEEMQALKRGHDLAKSSRLANLNPFLDHSNPTPRGFGYAVFGQVVEGMDVVDKIRQVKTGTGSPLPSRDVPVTQVVIKKVTVE